MKIGIITKPNEKGQIVIPKEVRDTLGVGPKTQLHITTRGKGIYIYPIEDFLHFADDTRSSYIKILQRTKGKWPSEKWNKVRAARKKIEINASKDRGKEW